MSRISSPLRPVGMPIYEGPRQQVMLACRVLYSLPFQKFEEFIVSKYLNSAGERLLRRGYACGAPRAHGADVHGRRKAAGPTPGAWERVQLGMSLCIRNRPGGGPRLSCGTRSR